MQAPRTRHTRLALAAAVLCVLVLTPAAALAAVKTGARSHDASVSSLPTCSTSGIDVWLDTQGNGTAGGVAYTLEFTNLSGHACTLAGFPDVSAVSLSGHTLGSAADHSGSRRHAVRLANGATTGALLQLTFAADFPPTECHAATAFGMKVSPPGQRRTRTVPFPFGACSKKGPIYLSVESVPSNNGI